jgi:hypothetical protein
MTTPSSGPRKLGFWMAYDLGLQGDYKNLFAWLDTAGAEECGNNLAYFERELAADETPDNADESIREDLISNVMFKENDRIYLISPRTAGSSVISSGRFIIGGRKTKAPWDGYGILQNVAPDMAVPA